MDTEPILIEQDGEVSKLLNAVKSLKDNAVDINSELKLHNEIIIDIENKTDHTNDSLLSTNKKVRLLASKIKNNKCNLCLCCCVILFVVVLILVICK